MPAGQVRRRSTRRFQLAAGLSVGVHASILLALLYSHGPPPPAAVLEPVPVELVEAPQLTEVAPPAATPAPPSPAPPAEAKSPTPAKTSPPKRLARRSPAPPVPESLVSGEGEQEDAVAELSEAQIAGAARAGSGGPGRPCDMVGRLQAALRKDPRVQAAVDEARRAGGAAGKALLVWNGDWVRSHGQEGNGLAAVREAIMWEVAFAPGACRREPVRGLVLLSLNDGARVVVGSDRWLWSDLLGVRQANSGAAFLRR